MPLSTPTRVLGGLLHRMWRVDTEKGSYAVKQLSTDIALTQEERETFERTERIASRFHKLGIPAVSALEWEGQYLIDVDSETFLVYPWVDASALDKDAISKVHAIKIAHLLAEIHVINLKVPELTEQEFDVHETKELVQLIHQTETQGLPFAQELRTHQGILTRINEAYQQHIPLLQKTSIVSHGDFDQKNILWDVNANPILIDWESARKINPTQEIISVALDWSGITTHLQKELFVEMIRSYLTAGGTIDQKDVHAAFWGILGNWLNWLLYNIQRSLNPDPKKLEEKEFSIEHIPQVLKTIITLESLIPELTVLIDRSSNH